MEIRRRSFTETTDPLRAFSTPFVHSRGVTRATRNAATEATGKVAARPLLDLGEDGALLALGGVCVTLFVAAVATAFVSVGWAAVVVSGWLLLVVIVCLLVCGARLRGRQ